MVLPALGASDALPMVVAYGSVSAILATRLGACFKIRNSEAMPILFNMKLRLAEHNVFKSHDGPSMYPCVALGLHEMLQAVPPAMAHKLQPDHAP